MAFTMLAAGVEDEVDPTANIVMPSCRRQRTHDRMDYLHLRQFPYGRMNIGFVITTVTRSNQAPYLGGMINFRISSS